MAPGSAPPAARQIGRRVLQVAAVLAAACDPAAGPPDAGGPDAGAVAQGSPATSDVAINEVSPAGDWVELVNRTGAPIALDGMFVTDKADRLDHYQPLAGTLAPGGVAAIDAVAFGLGDADEVHLIAPDGLVVDGLAYLWLDGSPGESLARRPHADGPFYRAVASRGEVNP